MSEGVYELLALAARYWFVLLIVVIVARAWRAAVVDNRAAKALRDWSGEANCVGELLVESGPDKLEGKRFSIPEEGLLGKGRMADVRIRAREVDRRHLWFQYADGYLTVKPLGKSVIAAPRTADGRFVLCDGDRMKIGSLSLMLVLYDTRDLTNTPEPPAVLRKGRKAKKPAQEPENPDDEFWS